MIKAIPLVPLFFLVFLIVQHVRVGFIYDRDIGDYWQLADKASTIEKKSEYMDRYVDALDRSAAMHGNDAVVFKTPNNSLEHNMEALRSLQIRLRQIRGMDVQSPSYQMAIQQITAQEQGEARELTQTLYGGWVLKSGYWYLWSWIGGTVFVVTLLVTAVSVADCWIPKNLRRHSGY